MTGGLSGAVRVLKIMKHYIYINNTCIDFICHIKTNPIIKYIVLDSQGGYIYKYLYINMMCF